MNIAEIKARIQRTKKRDLFVAWVREMEQCAVSEGLAGFFVQLKAPPFFYPDHPEFELFGAPSPWNTQQFLKNIFARTCRSWLKRNIAVQGIRLVRPSAGGTPVWTLYLWCPAKDAEEMIELFHRAVLKALVVDKHGLFNVCDAAPAEGYLLKVAGQYRQTFETQDQALVDAWSKLHRISQFQVIGS
ncbi:replication endonuclease [Iodobacter sp.]|uniref:replication endonuclease n=1 Tax=Iodobacter sp. TaxID=1915058 RepID=UPI0025D9A83B|nr:replication endonuclease [Iodobacter sp.]